MCVADEEAIKVADACRYSLRKARDTFRANASVTEAAKQQELLETARKELEAVKRQVLVYSLYARKQRSVMVNSHGIHTP